mmetsp:Transcript_82905/g.200938  ORF Transcript_82905/g.200938 Transcript_82905/m.200938 type:complete len:235 (-) Transcript_82905:12-716(-)
MSAFSSLGTSASAHFCSSSSAPAGSGACSPASGARTSSPTASGAGSSALPASGACPAGSCTSGGPGPTSPLTASRAAARGLRLVLRRFGAGAAAAAWHSPVAVAGTSGQASAGPAGDEVLQGPAVVAAGAEGVTALQALVAAAASESSPSEDLPPLLFWQFWSFFGSGPISAACSRSDPPVSSLCSSLLGNAQKAATNTMPPESTPTTLSTQCLDHWGSIGLNQQSGLGGAELH